MATAVPPRDEPSRLAPVVATLETSEIARLRNQVMGRAASPQPTARTKRFTAFPGRPDKAPQNGQRRQPLVRLAGCSAPIKKAANAATVESPVVWRRGNAHPATGSRPKMELTPKIKPAKAAKPAPHLYRNRSRVASGGNGVMATAVPPRDEPSRVPPVVATLEISEIPCRRFELRRPKLDRLALKPEPADLRAGSRRENKKRQDQGAARPALLAGTSGLSVEQQRPPEWPTAVEDFCASWPPPVSAVAAPAETETGHHPPPPATARDLPPAGTTGEPMPDRGYVAKPPTATDEGSAFCYAAGGVEEGHAGRGRKEKEDPAAATPAKTVSAQGCTPSHDLPPSPATARDLPPAGTSGEPMPDLEYVAKSPTAVDENDIWASSPSPSPPRPPLIVYGNGSGASPASSRLRDEAFTAPFRGALRYPDHLPGVSAISLDIS
jgi:hypothetical protein